jgi:hypothetical protein
VLPDLLLTHRKQKVPIVCDFDSVRSSEPKLDLVGIGARRQNEVEFKLALLASVKDQIDTGIYVSVLDLGVLRHVGPPLGRIAAIQIADLPGEFTKPNDSGGAICPLKPEADVAHVGFDRLTRAVPEASGHGRFETGTWLELAGSIPALIQGGPADGQNRPGRG